MSYNLDEKHGPQYSFTSLKQSKAKQSSHRSLYRRLNMTGINSKRTSKRTQHCKSLLTALCVGSVGVLLSSQSAFSQETVTSEQARAAESYSSNSSALTGNNFENSSTTSTLGYEESSDSERPTAASQVAPTENPLGGSNSIANPGGNEDIPDDGNGGGIGDPMPIPYPIVPAY